MNYVIKVILYIILTVGEMLGNGFALEKGANGCVAGSEPRHACCSSRCQSTGLRWLGWTQEYKNHTEDATVYPGSGQSVPYVQQLMILILKSTQNRGVTTGL